MFTGWRVRPRWAAALLIRSRKDLLERLRDHAVADGVRMDVAERAEPRPVADVCGTVHQVLVFEGACYVGDGIARRGVRVDQGRVEGIDAAADEQQRRIGGAERREHIVIGHGHDRDVRAGRRAEVGQDRAQVLHHPRRLRRAAGRLEQAGDFVALRVEAEEVVRPDVDRDERDLVFVRLEKADRLRKLRPFRIENVLVVTRGTAAQNDGRILAAEAHRHRRLASAAELDELKLRVGRDERGVQLLGVAMGIVTVRLEARGERVAK